jgi:hypothetical protein
VEIFGWNFSAKNYSSLEFISLSSAALVNAAQTVQSARESSVPDDRLAVRKNEQQQKQIANSKPSPRIFHLEKTECGKQNIFAGNAV